MDLFLIYVAIFCNAISIHYKVEEFGLGLLYMSETEIGFETSVEDVLDTQYRLFKNIHIAELVLFAVIGVLMMLLSPLTVLALTSILLFLMVVFV